MRSQLTRQVRLIPMDTPDPSGPLEKVALFNTDGTPFVPGTQNGSPVGTRMYRNTNLVAASGQLTVVPLQAVEFNDDDDTFELSGGKILVKRQGLFPVDFSMNFVGGSMGARNVQVTQNGDAPENMVRESGSSGTNVRPSGSGVLRCEVNDLIGLSVYVDGGTDVTLEAAFVKDVGLDMVRVGP